MSRDLIEAMSLKSIWSPGIAGLMILVGEFFYVYRPGETFLAKFATPLFLTLPLTTVLCLGAIAKAVLKRRSEETANKRPRLLHWLDIAFGVTGVCIVVFVLLVGDSGCSTLSTRVLAIIGFLICCGLGYLLFAKWKAFPFSKKILFTVVWVAVCSLSWLVLLMNMACEGPASPRDEIIADLTNLAAHSYQYRMKTISKGGGGGSFAGYVIPQILTSNENGLYSILNISSIGIALRGTYTYGGGTVTVTVDTSGRMIDWIVQGELDLWPPRDWREKIWRTW